MPERKEGVAAGASTSVPSYPQAWSPTSLRDVDWQAELPAECTRELIDALPGVAACDVPAYERSTKSFQLRACQAFMRATRGTLLERGTGFVRYRGLPTGECRDVEQAKALYWLLCSLVDTPQPQYFDRHMIYDLRYLGVPELDNEQANREHTNEIAMHSDESLPDFGPRYISLFCWRQAKVGGATRLASSYEAYRRLALTRPDLADRLHAPYLWQPERKTPADALYYHPVVTRVAGELRVQFSRDYNWRGYERFGEPFDDLGQEALAEYSRILEEVAFEFVLDPGDFVIFHNDKVTHGRTYHEDWEEPERKRHLLRLWLGTSGAEYPIPVDYRNELLSRIGAAS